MSIGYNSFMVTLILPGYAPKNKNWLDETAKSIKTDSEIRPVYWGHWSDVNSKFNASQKAHLLDGVSGKRVVDIVAKSIGTLVASYLIQKSPEKIRKVIFNGICLNDLTEDDKEVVKNALRKIDPQNVLVIQNDEDPHGTFDAIKNFLSEFGDKLTIISKPRADHEYFYTEDFNKFLLG